MQPTLKRKSQSLPRLKKAQLHLKSQRLAKIFSKQITQPTENPQQHILPQNISDPQQRHTQHVKEILLRSKSMKNKDKLQTARKFRILTKKSAIGPFLTGVDIYKQQQQSYKPYYQAMQQQPAQTTQQDLRQLLTQKYDDLSQLRKMIRKTTKNLGVYKKQTLDTKKHLLYMADRFDDPGVNVFGRGKLLQQVEEFREEV